MVVILNILTFTKVSSCQNSSPATRVSCWSLGEHVGHPVGICVQDAHNHSANFIFVHQAVLIMSISIMVDSLMSLLLVSTLQFLRQARWGGHTKTFLKKALYCKWSPSC